MAQREVDVFVVGAGPVGLAMAIEAGRSGLSVRIVDEKSGPETYSKAAAINARTLEIFQKMGVVEEFLARGRKVHGFNLYAEERRIGHVSTAGVDSPYPFILGLSQRETELLLAAHLEKNGTPVERRVRMTSLADQGSAVRVELAADDGTTESVSARWLCACDGAHSTVRHQLGVRFDGATYEESIVQADIRVEWPMPVTADEGLVFASPQGLVAALPVHAEGRYRLIILLSPEETRSGAYEHDELTVATFQRFMDERGPKGTRVSDPSWMAAFRFHRRLVEHTRVGRVFLLGDAAHIHSPVGGQGMNTGIHDANNLAWKLALATHGGPSLVLDSFEAERRPVAESILRWTDRATNNAERLLGLREPIALAIRNEVISTMAHVSSLGDRLANQVSETALDYRASPIVAQYRASIWPFHGDDGSPHDQPNLSDRFSFGRGPGPGERLVDLDLHESSVGATSLMGRLPGARHHLLVLSGPSPTVETYGTLDRLAEHARTRWAKWMDVHVVVPIDEPAALAFTGDVIVDADQAVHRHLGATSECLYLIRPDGFVAYRSQPADEDHLKKYVARVFAEA